MVSLMVLISLGCATTKKHHPVHAHHKPTKHTKVTAVGDDAAIKAIIKSLRE